MNLEQRIEKLERENQKLKRITTLILGLSAVALLTAAMPGQEIHEVLRARSIEVVNVREEPVITLGPKMGSDFAAQIEIRGPRGGTSSSVTLDAVSVTVKGDSGVVSAIPGNLMVGSDRTPDSVHVIPSAIYFNDADHVMKTDMHEIDPEQYSETTMVELPAVSAVWTPSSLRFADDSGTVRSQIGEAQLVTQGTGAETSYPAAVVLYDAEGNVIWRAPR